MKKDKKIRKLRHLIHKYDIYSHNKQDNLIEYLDVRIRNNYCVTYFYRKKHYIGFLEIKKIVSDLSLTSQEYFKIQQEEYIKQIKSKENLKINNLKETRDNKGVYIGNGGSNQNKVRVPSKKRSKRVWKIFYEMFPKFKN